MLSPHPIELWLVPKAEDECAAYLPRPSPTTTHRSHIPHHLHLLPYTTSTHHSHAPPAPPPPSEQNRLHQEREVGPSYGNARHPREARRRRRRIAVKWPACSGPLQWLQWLRRTAPISSPERRPSCCGPWAVGGLPDSSPEHYSEASSPSFSNRSFANLACTRVPSLTFRPGEVTELMPDGRTRVTFDSGAELG